MQVFFVEEEAQRTSSKDREQIQEEFLKLIQKSKTHQLTDKERKRKSLLGHISNCFIGRF